jgi:hypothetical protein
MRGEGDKRQAGVQRSGVQGQAHHEILKDMYGERSRVHLVQGDDGWEEPTRGWSRRGLLHWGLPWGKWPGAKVKAGQPRGTLYLSEEEGAVEAGWWSHDPTELQFSEGEMEYLIDLLMGCSGAGEDGAEPALAPMAPSTMNHQTGGGGATGKGDLP